MRRAFALRVDIGRIWCELRERIVSKRSGILIACCDGLKGFPQAIEAVFPKTVVQTCIVHMIRNSMRFVGWAQRKAVCAELRNVYAAPTEQAGLAELDAFEAKYAQRFPAIAS